MESVISIVLFSIPGLLVYFWLQFFGVNPTVKHSPTELAAISALFWIPTILLLVVTYDLFYLLFDLLFKQIGIDLTSLKLSFIQGLPDIVEMSNNFIFILYFFVLSIVFSFLVAFMWSKFILGSVLKIINRVRKSRELVELENETTVWDAFFLKLNNEDSEENENSEALVVEVYKLDKPDEKRIVGSITKMSRPYEVDRALVLENIQNNTESHEYYKYEVKRSYIDIKSGLVISELDTTKPTNK